MSDEPQYVVLDTNVLISAFLSSNGVAAEAALRAGYSYIIAMSPETFRELEQKLAEPKFDRFATADERRQYLDDLRAGVKFVEPTHELSPVSRDPEDDKFLALALSCGAGQIVSSDRHLTELKHYHDVQIWTPAQFLEHEHERDIQTANRQEATEPSLAQNLDHILSGIFSRIADFAVSAIRSLLEFFVSDSSLTRQQLHDRAQAAGSLETLHAEAVAEAAQVNEAEFDDRMHAQKTAQQEQDLSFAQRYGTPPTREANLGRELERD